MEIDQIEAFVEAQRRGSITRAAEALDLTQPTLTARVRSLEAELGVTLLARRYPDVDVRVVSGRSRAIAVALSEDEIEAGIVSQLVVLPDLAGRPLFDEEVPAVVAASHPLAKRAKVTLDEVASAGLVLRDPAS